MNLLRCAGVVALRVIDAIQTIPSPAMFGFLIPLPLIGGSGPRPAIAAWCSTHRCRSCAARSSACSAMGMTDRQLLWSIAVRVIADAVPEGLAASEHPLVARFIASAG